MEEAGQSFSYSYFKSDVGKTVHTVTAAQPPDPRLKTSLRIDPTHFPDANVREVALKSCLSSWSLLHLHLYFSCMQTIIITVVAASARIRSTSIPPLLPPSSHGLRE